MRLRFDYSIGLTLLGLTAFSAIALTLPTVQAEGTEFVDSTSITVPISCSVTSSGTESHNAEVNNGQTISDIGTTSIKVFCNDSTGYALYAIGYTDDEYGNNVLSSSLSSDYSIATSSTINTNTSSWAMKLTKTGSNFLPIIAGSSTDTNKQSGDPDFSGYTAVPATYAKVAYFPTSTDVGASANGSNLTTTYRAYVSSSQPAGAYAGQVKYTLVHPSTAGKPEIPVEPMAATDCPANSICYAPNSSDVEGTMISGVANTTTLSSISSKYPTAAKQTQTINASGATANVTSNSTATLVAPNYKREGYGFAGWSTDFTATNSSTIYGPNETINTGDLSTNGLILYPVWVESTGTLQEFSCASSGLTQATYDTTNNKMVATLSSVTALTDSRDGNVYAVARLADNQCWMIENLRLDSDDSTDSSLAQGFGGTFAGLPATTDSWSTSNYTLAQLNTNNTNATIMGGTGLNASSASLVNTPGYPFNTSTAGQQGTTFSWYSYGNYYSWVAAMANTNSLDSYTASEGAGTSICPHNWHLPYGNSSNTGNTAGGFYYLGNIMSATSDNTASSVKWRAFPNNFIYSGSWYGSSAILRGNGGFYWSSSAYNYGGNLAYRLLLYSSNVSPGTYVNIKYNGYSVRCVAGS